MQFIMESQKDTSLLELLNTFNWKVRKELQKVGSLWPHFAEGHVTGFENFTILLKENNKFSLYLKESLLIKCDKPEINRNIYSYPLGRFDWLLSLFVFKLFTYLLIWMNHPCNLHDILSIVDGSPLFFENASDERRNQKLILFKINMILSKNYSLIYWDMFYKSTVISTWAMFR